MGLFWCKELHIYFSFSCVFTFFFRRSVWNRAVDTHCCTGPYMLQVIWTTGFTFGFIAEQNLLHWFFSLGFPRLDYVICIKTLLVRLCQMVAGSCPVSVFFPSFVTTWLSHTVHVLLLVFRPDIYFLHLSTLDISSTAAARHTEVAVCGLLHFEFIYNLFNWKKTPKRNTMHC